MGLVKFINRYFCCGYFVQSIKSNFEKITLVSICLLLASCEKESVRLSNPEYFDTVIQTARLRKGNSYTTNACIRYLDSAYRAFPNPGVEDLYRKYSFIKSLVVERDNDYARAKIYCDSMLTLFDNYPKNDERFLMLHSMAYMSFGEILVRMNRFTEAFAAYHQGRLLIERVKDACEARSMYASQVGTAYYLQGNYKKAISLYQLSIAEQSACKAADLFTSLWNIQGVMDNIGLCYDKLGQLDSAEYYFQSALDLLNKNENAFPDSRFQSSIILAKGVIYGNLGDVYLKSGDGAKAEAMWKAGVAINLLAGSEVRDGQITQAKLVNYYLNASRFADAQYALRELRLSLDSFRNEAMEASYYYLRWQYHHRLHELPEAYESLMHYRAFEDSAGRLLTTRFPEIEKEFELLEYKHRAILYEKEDVLKTVYLVIILIVLVLTSVILLLIWQNWKRVRRHNEDMQKILKVVAHDLRSPINGISGLANVMLLDANRPETDVKLLGMIRLTAHHAAKLTREILSLNFEEQLEEAELEVVELHPFLQYVVNLLQFTAAEKNQKIELIGTTTAKSRMSHDKMSRVIQNLIGNALKFSAPGSTIQVSVTQSNSHVIFAVCDQGIGIPAELGNTIFDVFTKGKRPGTSGEKSFGLGLSISQKIVTAHNGHIWYENNAVKGTTFYVKLPAC